MSAITIRGSHWIVENEGQSVSYEMGGAPVFVRKRIDQITAKHGTVLDDKTITQPYVMHEARLLAEKYGIGHP